jgi:hypothetical protein
MSRKKKIDDELPVLTEVVGEATGGFPMLTEVVGEASGSFSALTEEIDEEVDEDYSAQTDLIEMMSAEPPAPADLTPQLMFYLENHLEKTFAQKLALKLAEAQQLAIDQTIAELKSELPQLIRDALATPTLPADQ